MLLAGLYRRACKFLVFIAAPCCLLLIGLAQPFLRLWMGSGFELAALTLQLLLPVYLVNVLTVPGVFVLNGINRPEVAMRAALCAGAVNLVACLILVQTAGYFGLIAGVAFSLCLAAGYFAVMLHRNLPELDRRSYGEILTKPILVALPVAWALHYYDALFPLGGVIALGLVGGTALVTVYGILLASGYLDSFEREQLLGLLPWRRSGKAVS
jgi:O-antigen/teichoic acid export membrane protein